MRTNLLVNTIKYLKPIQVIYRIKNKTPNLYKHKKIKIPKQGLISLVIPELDLDAQFLQKYSINLISEGKINILNSVIDLSFSNSNRSIIKPLYWYNLLYFEYAVTLAGNYRLTGDKKYVDLFETIYKRYLDSNVPYEPYVISLHIPNIIIALELFGDSLDRNLYEQIVNELYNQYSYLLHHQEKHLLCNHYLENLKCIFIASSFFNEERIQKKCLLDLKKQTREQILPDGMHFELSPMYHKIVLEDYLRIGLVLSSNNCGEVKWLVSVLQKMVNALLTLETDFDRIPLFNDSGDNVAKESKCLYDAAHSLFNIYPKVDGVCLPDAGYYSLNRERYRILVDAGSIGPNYNPGHGHCDCLSFEMSLDGVCLFVNSGTFQYQDELRGVLRSTAAHNTIVMDGYEQSQCWGEHRVAKRHKVLFAKKEKNSFTGTYKNYIGMIHTRHIETSNKGFTVLDIIKNANEARSYLHVSPSFSIDENLVIYDENGVKCCSIKPIGCDYQINDSFYSKEFGLIENNKVIVFSWKNSESDHGYHVSLI